MEDLPKAQTIDETIRNISVGEAGMFLSKFLKSQHETLASQNRELDAEQLTIDGNEQSTLLGNVSISQEDQETYEGSEQIVSPSNIVIVREEILTRLKGVLDSINQVDGESRVPLVISGEKLKDQNINGSRLKSASPKKIKSPIKVKSEDGETPIKREKREKKEKKAIRKAVKEEKKARKAEKKEKKRKRESTGTIEGSPGNEKQNGKMIKSEPTPTKLVKKVRIKME